MLRSLAKPLAFIKRDFYSYSSYRFSFVMQFWSLMFSMLLFYFIGKVFGRAISAELEPYGGDYFAFVLIGMAFYGYVGQGLSSFATVIREGQTLGTLEAMLLSPTRLSTLLVSSSLWAYLMITVQVAFYLVVGSLFFQVHLAGANYLAAVVILLLSVASFSGVGMLSASFILVIKRGDPIAWAVSGASTLLGGVYYPVAVLPDTLQQLAKVLPVTYSLEAMRRALLQGDSLGALASDMLALAIFAVILVPFGLLAFSLAVKRAKMEGSLAQY